MRADLFNFVSRQLQTRGNVKVYAGCRCWPSILPQICRAFSAGIRKPGRRYLPASRTSVCRRDPRVRQQITDIYEDLARHASFSGILFHDDAVLTDFEDVSPEAVAAAADGYGARCRPGAPTSARAPHGCVSKAKP